MVKELMHDPIFLAGQAEVATKEDLQVAQDLLDTLMAHKDTCVGMAANMIGVRKRIIAFLDESGRAAGEALIATMKSGIELYCEVQNNPSFKKWLFGSVFNATYIADSGNRG